MSSVWADMRRCYHYDVKVQWSRGTMGRNGVGSQCGRVLKNNIKCKLMTVILDPSAQWDSFNWSVRFCLTKCQESTSTISLIGLVSVCLDPKLIKQILTLNKMWVFLYSIARYHHDPKSKSTIIKYVSLSSFSYESWYGLCLGRKETFPI